MLVSSVDCSAVSECFCVYVSISVPVCVCSCVYACLWISMCSNWCFYFCVSAVLLYIFVSVSMYLCVFVCFCKCVYVGVYLCMCLYMLLCMCVSTGVYFCVSLYVLCVCLFIWGPLIKTFDLDLPTVVWDPALALTLEILQPAFLSSFLPPPYPLLLCLSLLIPQSKR